MLSDFLRVCGKIILVKGQELAFYGHRRNFILFCFLFACKNEVIGVISFFKGWQCERQHSSALIPCTSHNVKKFWFSVSIISLKLVFRLLPNLHGNIIQTWPIVSFVVLLLFCGVTLTSVLTGHHFFINISSTCINYSQYALLSQNKSCKC